MAPKPDQGCVSAANTLWSVSQYTRGESRSTPSGHCPSLKVRLGGSTKTAWLPTVIIRRPSIRPGSMPSIFIWSRSQESCANLVTPLAAVAQRGVTLHAFGPLPVAEGEVGRQHEDGLAAHRHHPEALHQAGKHAFHLYLEPLAGKDGRHAS